MANNYKPWIIGLVIILLLIVGVYLLSTRTVVPGQSTQQAPETNQSSPSPLYQIALSEVNNSGESGMATFKEADGKTTVSLEVTGQPTDVTQPAHIHEGSCPNVGEIKFALNSLVNSRSETTIDISLNDLLSQLPLAINVHKSGAELSSYVACGNLTSK